MMKIDISCSHIQVNLYKQRFPHINVRSICKFLPIKIFGIVIIVYDEKLLIFVFKFIERIGLFWGLLINLYVYSGIIFWGLIDIS